jgi:hypothetical protein
VRLEPRGHRCATMSLTGKCASTPFCNLKARRFIAGERCFMQNLSSGAHTRDPSAHPPYGLESLRQGRSFGWFAENAATTLA